MKLPPKKKPGDPVLAVDWNTMVDALAARTPRPGPGTELVVASGGFTYRVRPSSGTSAGEDFPWQMHAAIVPGTATPGNPGDPGVWFTPGTISSARAYMTIDGGEQYLDTKYGDPEAWPVLPIPEGRHVTALRIEWEPGTFQIPGGGPWVLVSGGSVASLEVITVAEDDWDAHVGEEGRNPEVDEDTGEATTGIFFQRVGVCVVETVDVPLPDPPGGTVSVMKLTQTTNDGIRHSGTGHFCAPAEFWISII